MKRRDLAARKSKRCSQREPSKSEEQLLTTRQLLQIARRRGTTIEAYLVLNGGLRATHWLTHLANSKYTAEGIDGEEYETTNREFAETFAWVGNGRVWHLGA